MSITYNLTYATIFTKTKTTRLYDFRLKSKCKSMCLIKECEKQNKEIINWGFYDAKNQLNFDLKSLVVYTIV